MVLLKINVDDKGNPALLKLSKNARDAQKRVEPLGETLKKVFTSAALLVGVDRLLDGFKGLTVEAGKFEQNMKRIQGIGGVTKGLDLMSKTVRDLAFTTEYSAAQISASMLDMIKAGFDDPQAVAKAMPNVINLSTTAMMDLSYAAENTVDILRAFGLENDETARVANVMANTLNMTTMEAEDYFEAIKYVSSISKNMNVSLEETSALLGMLANAGIKGSQAGTSLRGILLNLLQPGEAVAKGLKNMNLEGKSLAEILIGLKKQGLTVIDFLKTFDKIPITSTMTLANTTDKFRESYDKLITALETQSMSVKTSSEIIRDSYIDSLKQIKNMLGVLAIEFLDAFGPEITSAIDSVKKKLTEAREWIQDNQGDIKRLAETVGKLAGAFINLSGSVISTVVKNFEILINTVALLIGVKALGGLFTTVGKINTSFLTFTPTWSTSLANLTTSFNVAAAAAAGLYLYLDKIVQKENERTDQRVRNATDYSEAGLDKQISMLENIRLLRSEAESAQSRFKGVEGKFDYESQKQYMPLKVAAQEAWATLQGAKQEYANAGYMWTDVEEKNIDGAIKNLQRHFDLIRTQKKKIEEEGKKAPEKTLSDLVEEITGTTKVGKKEKDNRSLYGDIPEDWKYYDWFMQTLSSGSSKDYRTPQTGLRGSLAELQSPAGLPDYDQQLEDVDKEIEKVKLDIKAREEEIEKEKEIIESMKSSFWSLGQSTVDILDTIAEKSSEKRISLLEKEKEAIANRFDSEINSANVSAFKKEQLEQEKAQKTLAIERKISEEKEKAARKQKAIDVAVATAQMFKGIIGVVADTPGGPILRTAAGLEIAAVMGTYLASLLAVNLRSGGYVSGSGNATSDSIPANLSKGEYVVSASDVQKMGGPRGVQTAIDRSVSYSTNSNATIHIGTVIGEEYYVREYLMPVMRKELRR